MADPDQAVINGTCFSAPGEEATDNFIPCGNWAFGHVQCCQARDYCVENNACFNMSLLTLYVAGCTKFDYDDPNCPDKEPYADYPWVGLSYCDDYQWIACEQEGKPTSIEQQYHCPCPRDPKSRTVVVSATRQLHTTASLPARSGSALSWVRTYSPPSKSRVDPAPTTSYSWTSETTDSSSTTSFSSTSDTTESTDSSSAITSSSTLSLPTPTSTPTSITSTPTIDSVSQSHHLSDGAKAGIGIGSGVGGILLFGALSALWLVFRRRRHDKNTPANPDMGEPTLPTVGDNSPGPGTAEMPTPEAPAGLSLSELPVGPWVVRPELQGDATPAGYSHTPPPMSPSASPPLSPPGTGWQIPSPMWGPGVGATAIVAHPEFQQGHQAHDQGQNLAAPAGYAHVSMPGSASDPNWQIQGQMWVPGAASPSVGEERGLRQAQQSQLGQQGPVQGQNQAVSAGESRQPDGIVSELPA